SSAERALEQRVESSSNALLDVCAASQVVLLADCAEARQGPRRPTREKLLSELAGRAAATVTAATHRRANNAARQKRDRLRREAEAEDPQIVSAQRGRGGTASLHADAVSVAVCNPNCNLKGSQTGRRGTADGTWECSHSRLDFRIERRGAASVTE